MSDSAKSDMKQDGKYEVTGDGSKQWTDQDVVTGNNLGQVTTSKTAMKGMEALRASSAAATEDKSPAVNAEKNKSQNGLGPNDDLGDSI